MDKASRHSISTIRVVKTPAGCCPDWVRDAWVGVELPVVRMICPPPQDVDPRTGAVHAVRLVDAVEALREHGRTSAAVWWNDRALARRAGGRVLLFEVDDCSDPKIELAH